MKVATVIQDSLRSLGGGELVCMSTCVALQRLGYRVQLVSDRFEPNEVEQAFGMGDVLRKCEHIKIPELGRKLALFSSLPGILFASKSKQFFEKQNADVIFVTRDPRRPNVLPDKPLFRFVYELSQLRPFWENYNWGVKLLYRTTTQQQRTRTTYLAVSSTLSKGLKQVGYETVELVYPSYGIGFRPRAKKDQVVQVTFLAPQKRLDDFMEIARRLPEYTFYLVGRDTERVNRIYKGHARHLLASKPSNVEYVESRIREVPELLEESRIYLHTGIEPGMTIAVMEALSAGCVPIAPAEGGAAEVIAAAGAGFRYTTIDSAVNFIRSEMNEMTEVTRRRSISKLASAEIAERGRIFDLETFQTRIENVISRENPTS